MSEPTQTTTEPMPDVSPFARRDKAMNIVYRYTAMSGVVGMIPIAGLDVLALGGIHIALIKELVQFYGFEFSDHAARNVLIAVGVTLIPGTIGSWISRRMLSTLPFLAAPPVMALASAAVSYTLGNVLIKHFEAGGKFDTLTVDDLKSSFSAL